MSSASLFNSIQQSISELVAKYKATKSDGKVTIPEVTKLLYDSAREVVRITQSLPAVGADKKAAAMEALELFIDHVITPMDLSFVPNVIEPIVDRQLKSLYLLIADGAIESALHWFKQDGWK